MELKKSREANLENKRAGFFFVGLVMISALVLMAFNFREFIPDDRVADVEHETETEDLLFDIPPEEEPPPPPPEQAPPPPVIEDIEVVEDDEEVDEIDLGFIDDELEEIPDEEEPEIVAEEILDIAEVEPEFPGGPAEMAKWIQKNVVYPELSREMGEQGTVYVQFVVNKNGSIEQTKILRGVSDALDKEAKRVVGDMPRWKPGEQAGKPVRVRYTIPIKFKLS